MSTALEPRVSDLEHAMKELAYAQLRTEMSLAELSTEMKDFKDEMKDFKDEMKDFRDDMKADRKQMNRRWGELANRLGTIVEDVVAPNMYGVLTRYFGVDEPDHFLVRARRKHPVDRNRRREFDVIATSGSTVFLNETKATVRQEYLTSFAENRNELFEFFPEYEGRTLVSVFGSFYLKPEEIAFLTQNGIYAMMMSDDSMDIVNFDDVPK